MPPWPWKRHPSPPDRHAVYDALKALIHATTEEEVCRILKEQRVILLSDAAISLAVGYSGDSLMNILSLVLEDARERGVAAVCKKDDNVLMRLLVHELSSPIKITLADDGRDFLS